MLENRKLADPSVLDDPKEALRLGYRFDSFRDRYQAMFDVLKQRLHIPQDKVEDWLALPARERQPWFAKADLRASAALLLLEQASLRRQLLLAQDELKRLYLGHLDKPAGDQRLEVAGKTFQQILDDSGFLSRPAELLEGGYACRRPPSGSTWKSRPANARRACAGSATTSTARSAPCSIPSAAPSWKPTRPTSRRSARTCASCTRRPAG